MIYWIKKLCSILAPTKVKKSHKIQNFGPKCVYDEVYEEIRSTYQHANTDYFRAKENLDKLRLKEDLTDEEAEFMGVMKIDS